MSRRFLSPMKCSATQAMTWSADISVITPSVQCQLCGQSEASIQVMWSFSANQKLCGQSVVIKSFLIANPVPQTSQTLKNHHVLLKLKYLILLLILIDEMECITYFAGVVCGEGPGEPGPFSPGLLGHAHRELKTLRILFIRINRKL